MKAFITILVSTALLTSPALVRAQDASEQAIVRLQQEIERRQSIDTDPTVPADLKTQNRSILEKRRTELLSVIQARISALQKYLSSIGNMITPEEKEYAQGSLRRLSEATRVTETPPTAPNTIKTSAREENSRPSIGSGQSYLDANFLRARPSENAVDAKVTTLVETTPDETKYQVSGTVYVANALLGSNENIAQGRSAGPYSQNQPLLGAKIEAQKTSGGDKLKTVTDKTGKFTISLAAGDYIITASVDDFKVEEPVTVSTVDVNVGDLQIFVRPLGEYSRAIVGFEQAAASSASHTQKFFFDLTLSTPLPFGESDPYFGKRARLWGTARVTSVPQQITSGVATFSAGFAQQVGNLKVNEVAQGIEYLVGTEIRLKSRMQPFGSFDGTTTNRFTTSFIAGAGAITPINPKSTLEIFKVFPGAPGLPPVPAGKDFIAFVSPDRDRFFRQYFAGLRLQTYYFNYRNPDIPLKRYPAVLDITFGQNEAMTGGRLRGGVLRLEGFYPLPYDGLKFINLFGTALMKLSRTNINDPLILEAAPAGTTVPASNVFIQTIPQMNRDYYRIGVGIDFISLINKWRNP